MKRWSIIFLFWYGSLFSAETLIDNLIEGDLTTQIKIDSYENIPYGEDYTTRNKQLLFIFQTNLLPDLTIEAALQTSSFINRYETYDDMIYYIEALYSDDFLTIDYKVIANYYIKTNERMLAQSYQSTDAFGIKAALDFDTINAYIAYSAVGESTIDANTNLDSRIQLLPTNPILYSTNYSQGTEAYALGIAYTLYNDIRLGSRYVVTENETQTISYSGVYGTLLWDELMKDFVLKISYDKAYLDSSDEKIRFDFSTQF